jgi:hypothetical protein
MGQAWFLKPVILANREQRSGGSQLKAGIGKKFWRPHVNQWLGKIAPIYLPSYAGMFKEEDQYRLAHA